MSLNLELHSRELLLYPILKNVGEGILITDTSFNIIFFNDQAEQIYQIDSDDVLGKHIDILKPALNFESMVNTKDRLIHNREFINGEEVSIIKGLLKIAPGRFACYAILRTIDSLETLQLNSFLESPYEGIAIFDENARLIFANQVCYSFFQCKSKSELNSELAVLIPQTSLRDSISKGKPISGEIIFVNNRAVELIYLPIRRYGRTIGIIVKSSLASRQEGTWGQLVEKYNYGTAKYYLDNIVGTNSVIMKKKKLAARAARTISTVLITGESGTGKEVFAHAVHNMSPRRKGPFIKVNCAAVPETLLESELFGYAEGAFTGARKDGKPGKFELANQGTIFLDEIADMSLSMQAKLLRVLQEKEVERVGGIHTTKVNVRVIAATNQDLLKLVSEHKFREDLFYRLNVIIIDLPPLRERKEDIPLISNTLLQRLNRQLGTGIYRIGAEVIDCFCRYHWPGNIRELENTIERAINFCEGNVIKMEHLPDHILPTEQHHKIYPEHSEKSLEEQLKQHEKKVISDTLRLYEGNKSKTARALNIHRSVLYRKINKYNITI